jgi:hypothetical protein
VIKTAIDGTANVVRRVLGVPQRIGHIRTTMAGTSMPDLPTLTMTPMASVPYASETKTITSTHRTMTKVERTELPALVVLASADTRAAKLGGVVIRLPVETGLSD